MPKRNKPPVVILYHAFCRDGFASAWVAWKKFGDCARYIPSNHHAMPSITGSTIYAIDLAYPDAFLSALEQKNARVTVIDHHESAQEWITRRPQNVFDINHCGAVLAWKHFFPQKPVPRVLRHVEDEDLWRKKMPGTREITLALDALPQTFRAWDGAIRECESPRKRKNYLRIGAAIDAYRQTVIADIVSSSYAVRFAGKKVFVAHAPQAFRSEVGALLARRGKSHISIVWAEGKNRRYVSLRSDGAVDVGKLATRFGGGGHHNAAGFVVPNGDPLPWKKVENISKKKLP